MCVRQIGPAILERGASSGTKPRRSVSASPRLRVPVCHPARDSTAPGPAGQPAACRPSNTGSGAADGCSLAARARSPALLSCHAAAKSPSNINSVQIRQIIEDVLALHLHQPPRLQPRDETLASPAKPDTPLLWNVRGPKRLHIPLPECGNPSILTVTRPLAGSLMNIGIHIDASLGLVTLPDSVGKVSTSSETASALPPGNTASLRVMSMDNSDNSPATAGEQYGDRQRLSITISVSSA